MQETIKNNMQKNMVYIQDGTSAWAEFYIISSTWDHVLQGGSIVADTVWAWWLQWSGGSIGLSDGLSVLVRNAIECISLSLSGNAMPRRPRHGSPGVG